MGFMDKMKDMIGIEDNDYYDENDDAAYDEGGVNQYDDSQAGDSYSAHGYDSQSSYSSPSASPLIGMGAASIKANIDIQEPLEYDDGPDVLDAIAQGTTVILNLEMLEVDKKRQIFDFVSGGVYALHGQIQKVTKDIYVITPQGINVSGQVTDEAGYSAE